MKIVAVCSLAVSFLAATPSAWLIPQWRQSSRLRSEMYAAAGDHRDYENNAENDDSAVIQQKISMDIELGRREMIGALLAGSIFQGSTSIASAGLDPKDDPMAQLDAIAQQINFGSQGYSQSVAPLPTSTTTKQTSQEITATPASKRPKEGLSDFEAALQQSNQKRQIGPRTHG